MNTSRTGKRDANDDHAVLATVEGQWRRFKRQKLHPASTLCEACQPLDLDKSLDDAFQHFQLVKTNLIKGPDGSRPATPVRKGPNGTWHFEDALYIHSFGDRLAQESACPLCTFFRAMRVQPGEYENYKLLAWPSSESWMFQLNALDRVLADMEYTDTVFMAVVPDIPGLPGKAYDCDMMEIQLPATGVIYRLQADETREPSLDVLVRPRELAAQASIPLASGWLRACKEYHGEACKSSGSRPPINQGFRLIDCTVESTTPKPQPWGTPYAALSYVWGTTDEDKLDWPRTVLDAVLVTKALGMRYLWVDRLCINQGDPKEKQYLISKMTDIYQCADITLFAAAGSGASYGLPGVGPTPRNAQPRYTLDSGSTLVSILRDPRRDVMESTHWTRGWTYQEGVLSNRRLVFTDNQMYWECNHMATQESLATILWHQPGNKREEDHPTTMADFMIGGIFKGHLFSGGPFGEHESINPSDDPHQLSYGFAQPVEIGVRSQFRGIDEHIRDYSKRRLSHDTDSLNAFLGITSAYTRLPDFYLLHGLPLWMGKVAGSFSGARITFGLAVSAWYHLGSGIQSTFTCEASRRRTHFPSWSWAGWDAGEGGAITWRSPPQFEHAALTADLIKCNLEDAWPLWAADVHLFNKGQFRDNRPPAKTVRLGDCVDGIALGAEKPDYMVLQNPWVLKYFRRALVDTDRSPGSTFMWQRQVGRIGRAKIGIGEGAEWDRRRYRIAGRLCYIGMSVQMTEEDWEAKHNNGEIISVLMFASRYPDEVNRGHGTAKFITLRKAHEVAGRKWQIWERIGILSLTIQKETLDKCKTEESFLRKLPVRRDESVIIIE